MKPRLKFGPLSSFLFLSIFLHSFLFLFLFWTERHEPLGASWSGGLGKGANVTYVNLDDFFTLEKFSSGTSTPIQSPQKNALKNKTIQTSTTTPQTPQKKSWGIGSSSTPAGGMGSGLDKGQTSANSSSVIALIRKKIREQQKYPQIARDNDWTGTTQVGFQIDEDGSLKFIKILHSSGHDILDASAVKAVKNAAPLPYFSEPMALSLEYQMQ